MKSPSFAYIRAQSLDHALSALADTEDAIVLAGGQSLVAALNLRLQVPELVVDINHVPGLDLIEIGGAKFASERSCVTRNLWPTPKHPRLCR